MEVVLNDAPDGYVIADAIKLVCAGGTPPPRTLDYIEVEGPSSVEENTEADFVCRAYYSDNTNAVVSAGSWTDGDCASAEIDDSGHLTTFEVAAGYETCTVTASYTEDSVEHQSSLEVRIYDTDIPPPAEVIIDDADAGFSSGPSPWPTSPGYVPGSYNDSYHLRSRAAAACGPSGHSNSVHPVIARYLRNGRRTKTVQVQRPTPFSTMVRLYLRR